MGGTRLPRCCLKHYKGGLESSWLLRCVIKVDTYFFPVFWSEHIIFFSMWLIHAWLQSENFQWSNLNHFSWENIYIPLKYYHKLPMKEKNNNSSTRRKVKVNDKGLGQVQSMHSRLQCHNNCYIYMSNVKKALSMDGSHDSQKTYLLLVVVFSISTFTVFFYILVFHYHIHTSIKHFLSSLPSPSFYLFAISSNKIGI